MEISCPVPVQVNHCGPVVGIFTLYVRKIGNILIADLALDNALSGEMIFHL